MTHRVFLELGPTKIVAYSLDWPGWTRSGQTEHAALMALTESAERYQVIAELAGFPFEPGDPVVVTHVNGTEPVERSVKLLQAAWETFDLVVAESPQKLRTGSRDDVVAHVVEAEQHYAAKIGVHSRPFTPDDRAALTAMREEIVEALGKPSNGSSHAAHQIIGHVIEHIWEIEDSRF